MLPQMTNQREVLRPELVVLYWIIKIIMTMKMIIPLLQLLPPKHHPLQPQLKEKKLMPKSTENSFRTHSKTGVTMTNLPNRKLPIMNS